MEKKPTLLFEASNLTANFEKNCYRTGIFFAPYNILKELSKQNIFNIVLHFNINQKKYLRNIKNDKLFSKFTYIFSNCNLSYNDNIEYKIDIHKYRLKEKGLYNKVIRCLKIIKNYLRIIRNLLYYDKNYYNIIKNTDLYFTSWNYKISDEIERYKNIKIFFLLYDTISLLFPKYFPGTFTTTNYIEEFAKIHNLKSYYYYCCISNNTKNDILKYYNNIINNKKIFTAYISSAQEFYPDYNKEKLYNVLKKYNINKNDNDNYIFSLCTIEPRKNLIFTVICFLKFIIKHGINNLYFYLAGSDWDFFMREFEKVSEELIEYKNKIIRLGYIDDEDVNTFLSNSIFFTYISQYEGFGMPPLEAMQAGTPVITSNNSSLPEVVEDAAIKIDYNSEEQCIKAFEDLYFNEDLRNEYIKKGLKRAEYFSWEKTVNVIKEKMLDSIYNNNLDINIADPLFDIDNISKVIKQIYIYDNENNKNILNNMFLKNEILAIKEKDKKYFNKILSKVLINDCKYKIINIPRKYKIIKNNFLIETNNKLELIYSNENEYKLRNIPSFPVNIKKNTLYKVLCEIIEDTYNSAAIDFYAGPEYDLKETDVILDTTALLPVTFRYAYINSFDTSLAKENQIYLRIMNYGTDADITIKNIKLYELIE